jgi:CBS domain-containing protein
MDENAPKPKVSDALVLSTYRIYPDTPLPEIVGLMVRRRLHALPVVGEQYEVLGILTSGDALAYTLSWGGPGRQDSSADDRTPPVARDVMTRSVLCVSEDQPLTEAANMLVNRDVEQLPVVREGEFIGFITRDSVLRSLSGVEDSDNDEEDPTT